MAVVAVGGDDRVLVDDRRLHADDDGFLADIEVAEAADQAHAVELACPLLEAADQQHVAIEGFQLVGGQAVVASAGGFVDAVGLAGDDSTFGFVAGFAIDFPSAYPVAAYSIAQGDVVDLAAKNQPREESAQHLRECLQGPLRTGQFVSGGREANLINASPMTPVNASA